MVGGEGRGDLSLRGGDGVTKSEVLLVLRFVVLGVGF